jgi:hypothetical protein
MSNSNIIVKPILIYTTGTRADITEAKHTNKELQCAG